MGFRVMCSWLIPSLSLPRVLLYFGGRNGFTRFDPASIVNNPIPPKLAFSGLRIFDRDVAIGDTVNGRVIIQVHQMHFLPLPCHKRMPNLVLNCP